MWYKTFFLLLIILIAGYGIFSIRSSNEEKPLVVYAGKGLRRAVDDIVHSFEEKHKIKIHVVYGASRTLLSVIQQTRRGDIFIPGGMKYIEDAHDLIAYYQLVAVHVPAVFVRSDNSKNIQSFQDLAKPGIRMAVGSKTAAVGISTDQILSRTDNEAAFRKNIVIRASTANELLDLVINKEVDASITHAHMANLITSEELKKIDIPAPIAQYQKIPLGVLNFSEERKKADLFAEFMNSEGRSIFIKHGFGE